MKIKTASNLITRHYRRCVNWQVTRSSSFSYLNAIRLATELCSNCELESSSMVIFKVPTYTHMLVLSIIEECTKSTRKKKKFKKKIMSFLPDINVSSESM